MPKKTVPVPLIRATTTISANGSRPIAIARTSAAYATQRIASHAIIVRLRSQRSATTPAGRVRTRSGIVPANPTTPAFAGDPVVARTSSGRATPAMRPPSCETTCPAQRMLKSRLRRREVSVVGCGAVIRRHLRPSVSSSPRPRRAEALPKLWRFSPYRRSVLARAITHALVGLEPRRVEVVAHVYDGTPAFVIVGLYDRACAEARQRVKAGIASAELEFPRGKVTVNLAPAGLRKEGSGYDLPIALAVLAASRQVPHDALDRHAAVGELALDGRLRRVGGVLAVAEGARRMGLERVLCPADSAAEVALAGVEPVAFRHLADTVAYLRGEREPDPVVPPRVHDPPPGPDLADVRGE